MTLARPAAIVIRAVINPVRSGGSHSEMIVVRAEDYIGIAQSWIGSAQDSGDIAHSYSLLDGSGADE